MSSLNTLVPSMKVYRGRVPERTAIPYARLRIREASRELTSGTVYIATMTVEIDCYIKTEAGTTGPLRAALDTAFNGTDSAPAAGITVSNGTLLHIMADGGSTSEPTRERFDGLDVVRVSAAFRALVQGAR